MHDPVTTLMRALADGIEADETFATHFAALAKLVDARGDRALADALARHGPMHRAKAITLRARLGALEEEYGALRVEQRRG